MDIAREEDVCYVYSSKKYDLFVVKICILELRNSGKRDTFYQTLNLYLYLQSKQKKLNDGNNFTYNHCKKKGNEF